MTPEQLMHRLERLPRADVAVLPTPLQRCPRLGVALGGFDIWIKRDDMTGVAMGGNKSRQLDFILGHALTSGATAIVTTAGVQSNQCRQTAAAATRLGLPVFMLLRGDPPAAPEGNYLLDHLFDPEIRFIPSDRSNQEVVAAIEEWMDELQERNLRPYFLDLINYWSDSSALGAVSYAGMVAEVARQMGSAEGRLSFYLNCGAEASATLAGVHLGCRALGLTARVVGVPADRVPESVYEETLEIARAAGALLGIDEADLPQLEMRVEHSFAEEGYGIPSREGMEAIRLAATTEGLLLEPVYTGKAMAALVDDTRSGRIARGERAIFVHTGGSPLLFMGRFADLLTGQAPPD
jgi:1-aminocyclopropane-1-carboxylate deaminase/D-cysteine desulfhydrase-like pyridoxal-dependent ACC family enzyme